MLRPVPWHVQFFFLATPGTALGNGALADLLGRPKNDGESADLFADLIVNALRVR